MANAWLAHVKATMKSHKGMKFKDVLKAAKRTYKSKGVSKKHHKKHSKTHHKRRPKKGRSRRHKRQRGGGGCNSHPDATAPASAEVAGAEVAGQDQGPVAASASTDSLMSSHFN